MKFSALPPKKYEPEIQPGDMLGDFLYVCDKPLGIEDGEVVIPKDNEDQDKGFALFIQQVADGSLDVFKILKDKVKEDEKNHLEEAIAKFNVDYSNEISSFLDCVESVDYEDQNAINGKRLLMKGYLAYLDVLYSNKFVQINALVKDGNPVYVVKQDGRMVNGKVGPSREKVASTGSMRKKKFELEEACKNSDAGLPSIPPFEDVERMLNQFVDKINQHLSGETFCDMSDDKHMKMLSLLGKSNQGFKRAFPNSNLNDSMINDLKRQYQAFNSQNPKYIEQFIKYRGKVNSNYKGKQTDPDDANFSAIQEVLATKVAAAQMGKKPGEGIQEIETIEGEFGEESNAPKIAAIVGWATGFTDWSGQIAGGQKSGYDQNYVVVVDANKQIVRKDDEGNIYRKVEKEKGNFEYYKIQANESVTLCEKSDYDNAYALVNNNIRSLGENLIQIITMGDRDALGSEGQNKGMKPVLDLSGQPVKNEHGENQYAFFGIDYGKALSVKYLENPGWTGGLANPFLPSLNDDFSFDNPPKAGLKGIAIATSESVKKSSTLCNISLLTDNTLPEKMQGVYLKALLNGKPILGLENREDQIQVLIQGYDALSKNENESYVARENYKSFVSLLEGFNSNNLGKNKETIEKLKEIITRFDDLEDMDGLNLLKNEILLKIDEVERAETLFVDRFLFDYEILFYRAKQFSDPDNQSSYANYVKNIEKMEKLSQESDAIVLDVFKRRLSVTPENLLLLENVEKLTARSISDKSVNGKVMLRHLRVDPKDRTAWDLNVLDNGDLEFICRAGAWFENQAVKELSAFLEEYNVSYDKRSNNLIIKKENLEDLKYLLTEQNVAGKRGLVLYDDQALAIKPTILFEKTLTPTQPITNEEDSLSDEYSSPSYIDEPSGSEFMPQYHAMNDGGAGPSKQNPSAKPTHERKRSFDDSQFEEIVTVSRKGKEPAEPDNISEPISADTKASKAYPEPARRTPTPIPPRLTQSPQNRLVAFKEMLARRNDYFEIKNVDWTESKRALDVRFNNIQQTIVRQKSDDSLGFSVKKGMSFEDFQSTVDKIARIAVEASEPGSEVRLSISPSDQRYDLLKDAVQRVIDDKYKNSKDKPVVVDKEDRRSYLPKKT